MEVIVPIALAAIAATTKIALALLARRRRKHPMNATEPTAPKKLLNTRQLARELGVSSNTIRSMTNDGRIPCHARISKRTRRYDLAAVLQALRQEAAR